MFRQSLKWLLAAQKVGVIKGFRVFPTEYTAKKTGEKVKAFNHQYSLTDGGAYRLMWEPTDAPVFPIGTPVSFYYEEREYNGKVSFQIQKDTFAKASQADLSAATRPPSPVGSSSAATSAPAPGVKSEVELRSRALGHAIELSKAVQSKGHVVADVHEVFHLAQLCEDYLRAGEIPVLPSEAKPDAK